MAFPVLGTASDAASDEPLHLPRDVQQCRCSSHLHRIFLSKQSYRFDTYTVLKFLDGTPRFPESVNALACLHGNELLQAVCTGGVVKCSI